MVFLESRFEPYKRYDPDRPIVGAGGTRIYEIVGNRAGAQEFKLAYARVWEYDNDWENYTGTKYEYNFTVE